MGALCADRVPVKYEVPGRIGIDARFIHLRASIEQLVPILGPESYDSRRFQQVKVALSQLSLDAGLRQKL